MKYVRRHRPYLSISKGIRKAKIKQALQTTEKINSLRGRLAIYEALLANCLDGLDQVTTDAIVKRLKG